MVNDDAETHGGLTVADRVVLLGVARLAAAGETPAHTAEIVGECREVTEALDAAVPGTVSEADATRALTALGRAGHVEQVAVEDPSPVGKGRPTFDLAVPVGTAADVVAGDERLAAAADLLPTDS